MKRVLFSLLLMSMTLHASSQESKRKAGDAEEPQAKRPRTAEPEVSVSSPESKETKEQKTEYKITMADACKDNRLDWDPDKGSYVKVTPAGIHFMVGEKEISSVPLLQDSYWIEGLTAIEICHIKWLDIPNHGHDLWMIVKSGQAYYVITRYVDFEADKGLIKDTGVYWKEAGSFHAAQWQIDDVRAERAEIFARDGCVIS